MFGKGALILVLGFGLIFGIVGTRLGRLQSRAIENMSYYHDVTKSHNLASMGANVVMSKLYQDSTLRGLITTQSFSSGLMRGGSFTGRIDSISNNRLRVRSVSTFQSYNDTVEVFVDKSRNQSFSMFAWMTDFENGVYWITGDTVWGRVHSNGQLNISGSPVFMEKVTTTKTISPKPGTGASKGIYKKGYETGVAPIKLPTDMSELVTAASGGGKKYTNNIWVTLSPGTSANNDGKAYIRYSATGAIVDSVSLSDATFNGVIYGTKNVYVKGVVDGKLSIGSDQDIHVIDDVTYAQNPLVTSSDDMLGLVANSDVIVDDNTANHTNCEIDASVFCRTGSFTAENYNTRGLDGWLRLVGGIIQKTRGAVGTFSGSGIINHGFLKRYYFDQRLGDPSVRPPYFPGFYRGTLAIVSWWESVRTPSW